MQFPRLLVVRQKFPDRTHPGCRRRSAESNSPPLVSPASLKPGARVAIGVGQPRDSQYRHHRAQRGAVLEGSGHAALPVPGHGKPRRGYRPRDRPRCWRTTASPKRPWAARSSASSKWSRWARPRDGIEAFMDRMAYESDGVMLVGRVKWHTDFAGKIESGLFKMMAIGLGKFAGAQRYHAYAYKLGLEHVIRSVGRQVLEVGQDSGRPGHSGRRQSQYRQAGCRSGGGDGAARRGEPGAGEDAGWRGSRWTWTS